MRCSVSLRSFLCRRFPLPPYSRTTAGNTVEFSRMLRTLGRKNRSHLGHWCLVAGLSHGCDDYKHHHHHNHHHRGGTRDDWGWMPGSPAETGSRRALWGIRSIPWRGTRSRTTICAVFRGSACPRPGNVRPSGFERVGKVVAKEREKERNNPHGRYCKTRVCTEGKEGALPVTTAYLKGR